MGWFEGFAGKDLYSMSGLPRPRVFQIDKSVGFGLLEREKENRKMELHAYIPMVDPLRRNLDLSEVHGMRYAKFSQNIRLTFST